MIQDVYALRGALIGIAIGVIELHIVISILQLIGCL